MALLANEQWNSQLQNPELGKDNKLLSIFVKKNQTIFTHR